MDAEPRLEKLASGLSISCFRYRPDGAGPEAIDRINDRIQAQLVATGEIALSPTTLAGRYSLRVCFVNFRRTEERRGGIEWVRTCRSRWARYHSKKKKIQMHKQ